MTTDTGPRLAVLVTGASAALDLTAHLTAWRRELNAQLSVMLSTAALSFLNPDAVSLIADEVVTAGQPRLNPVEFANRADLFVVCPATANFVTSSALGLASSPGLTAALATPAPRLMFPHMNPTMWQRRTTRSAVQTLREDGWIVVSPDPMPVLTLWNREFHDSLSMPNPSRTAEILGNQWQELRGA
jgi:phosphopantothenoylcysteine synthetase/decarboxylase